MLIFISKVDLLMIQAFGGYNLSGMTMAEKKTKECINKEIHQIHAFHFIKKHFSRILRLRLGKNILGKVRRYTFVTSPTC